MFAEKGSSYNHETRSTEIAKTARKVKFLVPKKPTHSISEDSDYPPRRSRESRRESDKDNEKGRRAQLLWSLLVALGVSLTAIYETSKLDQGKSRQPAQAQAAATQTYDRLPATQLAGEVSPAQHDDSPITEVQASDEASAPLEIEPVTD